ncbi:MAG: restriction endonuclease subunit R [Leptolyngbyaceae cyanobacterium SM1_3_5]|nr:restriction endonuclease subunit R [Leptolyngbyaceae cyanobacterium SM1_3_5]
MQTLNAKNLTLDDVHRLFGIQQQVCDSFTDLLSLEPLTDFEQQELEQIQQDFGRYLSAGKVSEGQIKFLVVAPLMRLAGFYRSPLQITLEEDIESIVIQDEETTITGRLNILTVAKNQSIARFWILVIESKNSSIDVFAGLPQLLTYTYRQLEQQSSVWGLVTNGRNYLFVYSQQNSPPIYTLLPELSLTNLERRSQLLQVLKAIRQGVD